MSSKVVIGALLVALALGVIAFVVVSPSGPGAPGGRLEAGAALLPIRPSQVRAITVTHASGATDQLTIAGERWTLQHGTDGTPGADAPSWPVEAVRVRSLLRIISELRSSGAPDPDAVMGEAATAVVMRLDDGTDATLRLSNRRLGGLIFADATQGATTSAALIADDLLDALTPGAVSWRDTGILSVLPTDASRVSMQSPRGTVALARINRAWRVLRPVGAPADEAAVERLLRAVSAVRITDFLDAGTDTAETGLDTPTATVTLETDRRIADPDNPGELIRLKETFELVLGGAANAAGTRLYARTPIADHIVVVDPTPLTALSVAAEPYVRGACIGVPAGDVGSLTVSTAGEPWRRYRRTLQGWGEAAVDEDASGSVSLLEPQAGSRVEALNAFLSTTAPSRVVLEPPAGFEPSIRVELGSLDLSPLEVIEVAPLAGAPADPDGGPEGATPAVTEVVVRTGPVYRVFPAEQLDPLLGQLLNEQAIRAASGADAGNNGTDANETGVTGVDVTK